MSVKIITDKKRKVDLDYGDLNIVKWDTYGEHKLTENILIIDAVTYYSNYDERKRDAIANGILDVKDKIGPFLRSDGVVIVFSSPKYWHDTQISGKKRSVSNDDLFEDLGISLSLGDIQDYECHLQVGNKLLEKYVGIAGKSNCYLEYGDVNFEEVTELITRGPHGSVCGATFTSYNGSGNGSITFLPRPDDLTVRPEKWLEAILLSTFEYVPQEIKEEILPNSSDENNAEGESASSGEYEAIGKILRVCERFPRIALQLEDRHNDRDTIKMDDEYDVQDLLHAVLWSYFNDVREEEYSPSHGGSSSRIDFLLKNEQIAIEVKYATENNKEKELKNQLAEDKEHYKSHSDCKSLVCYIYDPNFIISNPSGFENDLSSQTGDLPTEVVISPKTPNIPIGNG